MNIDFFTDLADEIRRLLQEAKLPVPSYEQLRSEDKRSEEIKSKIQNYDLKNMLTHFFTVYSRLVPVIPWSVHISDKIKGNEKINDIVKKLENGDNINNLLSNRVKKLNQTKSPDLLKYEWGIHHLHFDEKRSEELLFVYFDERESCAYLIDILKHEKPDSSINTWCNTDLVQIIHDNWPNTIKPYIFKNNSNTQKLTLEQRRNFRSMSGNTTVVTEDGTEYFPLGGGFTLSKHPTSATIKTSFILAKVKDLENSSKANFSKIKKSLPTKTLHPKLKLRLDKNLNPEIIETETASKIILIRQKQNTKQK